MGSPWVGADFSATDTPTHPPTHPQVQEPSHAPPPPHPHTPIQHPEENHKTSSSSVSVDSYSEADSFHPDVDRFTMAHGEYCKKLYDLRHIGVCGCHLVFIRVCHLSSANLFFLRSAHRTRCNCLVFSYF